MTSESEGIVKELPGPAPEMPRRLCSFWINNRASVRRHANDFNLPFTLPENINYSMYRSTPKVTKPVETLIHAKPQ